MQLGYGFAISSNFALGVVGLIAEVCSQSGLPGICRHSAR
jgi:hypothetical protein